MTADDLSPAHDQARAARLWRDAALLARLRGEEPPTPSVDPVEALRERAAEDTGARAWLEALAREPAQADRVARALSMERARVELPDGSALSLDEAERTLARKEEAQTHAPLRALLDEATAPFIRFDDHRTENIDLLRDRGPAWLAATAGAAEAARAQLAAVARQPLTTGAALQRALDLPRIDGRFSHVASGALIQAARASARTPDRALRRVAAPRQLHGVVIEKADSVSLCTFEPVLRFERHARSVCGAALALQLATSGTGSASRAAGVAFSIDLLGARVRRSVLALARGDAEQDERLARAGLFLRLRAGVALLLHAQDGEDAARGAVIDAVAADPGRRFVRELSEQVDAEDLVAQLDGAALYVALRDAFDEGFALRPEAWEAARELPAPALDASWGALVLERA